MRVVDLGDFDVYCPPLFKNKALSFRESLSLDMSYDLQTQVLNFLIIKLWFNNLYLKKLSFRFN